MLVKVTSKRQVTFPESVLTALGAVPGAHLELQPRSDGFLLRPHSIDHSKLAPLREKIKTGHPSFELNRFRSESHDPSLRH